MGRVGAFGRGAYLMVLSEGGMRALFLWFAIKGNNVRKSFKILFLKLVAYLFSMLRVKQNNAAITGKMTCDLTVSSAHLRSVHQ